MERPVKKPRLQGPDGFQKSKPTSRYKPPESITKFISAFDDGRPPSSSSCVKPDARPKSPPKKHVSPTVTGSERQRNLFVNFDVPRWPEAGPSRPSAASAPKRSSNPLSSAQTPRLVKGDKELPLLKVLKPPVFLPSAAASPRRASKDEPSSKTSGASLSSLQPVLKLPPVPPEKPRSVLKPPPVPVPSSSKPSVPLKSLAPPPPLLPHRPTSPTKPMKTILTTNIAQAIDPTKEGAGPELLSLFLQQHGHNFTSSTDRELQRGVMVSPNKRSHGKDRKFIRGGLAERFQHRITCAKTDFVLWRRQVEQKIESGSRMASDMQLRILRVLDVAKVSERWARTTSSPRAGLALCRLVRRHQLASKDLTLGTYVVLFHFAPMNGGIQSAVSSTDRFEEGNDVMTWMPWHKVDLAGVEGNKELLEMFRALDILMPPHSLLVVSRFCVVAPRPVNAT